MEGIRLGVGAQLGVLVGVLVQRQDRAGDGVAGGVVAADDQQHEVAEIFARLVACSRWLAVRQHRDQVAGAAAALTRSFHSSVK